MKKIIVFLMLVLFSANLVLANDFDANAFLMNMQKRHNRQSKITLAIKAKPVPVLLLRIILMQMEVFLT